MTSAPPKISCHTSPIFQSPDYMIATLVLHYSELIFPQFDSQTSPAVLVCFRALESQQQQLFLRRSVRRWHLLFAATLFPFAR